MHNNSFKHLYAKLKMSKRAKPRQAKDRLAAVEADIRDLRGTIRELLETLERELGRDLDRDQVVGRVSRKRPLPKTARLARQLPTKPGRSSALPMHIP